MKVYVVLEEDRGLGVSVVGGSWIEMAQRYGVHTKSAHGEVSDGVVDIWFSVFCRSGIDRCTNRSGSGVSDD